jgi:pimeloyl-ACP methyl ester carboxylesterase
VHSEDPDLEANLTDANAYFMFKHLKSGQLIRFPDSGHGVLFQYPESFVSQAALFLGR